MRRSSSAQNLREQLVARERRVDLELRGDLDHRAERARRRDTVAVAGHDRHGDLGEERRHQRGLAGAGLAADENQRATAGTGVLEILRQRGELAVAFNQAHAAKVGRVAERVNGSGPRWGDAVANIRGRVRRTDSRFRCGPSMEGTASPKDLSWRHPRPRRPRADAASDKLDRGLLLVASVVVVGAMMSILDVTVVNVAIKTLAAGLPHPAHHHPVGGHRVHARPGHCHPADRLGCGPVRHQAPLPDVDRAVRAPVRCCPGCAWNAGSLITFRVLQGLGGGMLMPVGMTILTRAAGPQRVGRVMAVIGVPMLLAPIFGPILGGWLVDDYSWRWIFFINVPMGLLAVILSLQDPAARRHIEARAARLARAAAPLARASRC